MSEEESLEEWVSQIQHKHQIKLGRLAKKRKIFLYQKLTRRSNALQAKKGTEQQIQKNHRKSQRLKDKARDLKTINMDVIIKDIIKAKFLPKDDAESVESWFMNELLNDTNSFMAYVNLIKNGDRSADDKDVDKSLNRNKLEHRSGQSSKNTSKRSPDDVLDGILSAKRNRPGQRARQKKWEEVYGKMAKHLQKDKNQGNIKKREKPRSAQEIMRDLRETKDKPKEKKEHPSWVAKKQQSSQSTQIDVFSGTKTVFDDDDED